MFALLLGAFASLHGCGSDSRPAATAGGNGFAPTLLGPCEPDGAQRSCHAVISQHDGFVDCFNGSQTCQSGTWSPCQGDPATGGTIATRSFPSAGGLSTLSLSTAGASGAPCSADPCNPNCVGFNEIPPSPIAPSCAASTTSAALIPTANQQDNMNDCSQANGQQGCWWANECCAKPGSAWVCASQESSSCKRCSSGKADYSASVACVLNSNVHQWVCNQGSAGTAAPTTGSLVARFWDGGSHGKDDLHQSCSQGGDWSTYYGKCTVDLSVVSLGSTACVDVFDLPKAGVTCVNAAGTAWTPKTALVGKKFVTWVNGGNNQGCTTADGALDECTWWNNVGGVPTAPSCSVAADCPSGYSCTGSVCIGPTCTSSDDCMAGAICTGSPKKCKLIQPVCPSVNGAPVSHSETYSMSCPAGFKGQWGVLAFDANTPTGTDIKFSVQTATSSAGPWTPSTAGPPAGLVVADAPVDHPSACTMTGPAPCGGSYGASCSCPIDLYTPLKAASPGAELNSTLQVNMLLTPACGKLPTFTGSASTFGGSPPGFTSKGICGGGSATAITTDCVALTNCSSSPQHFSQWDACQFDYHCDTTTKKCTQNAANWTWPLATCPVGAGPDLTLGPSCNIGGEEGFPVCNRGNDPITAGSAIEIAMSSSWSWPGSAGGASTYATPSCTYTPTSDIASGACVFVTAANSGCPVGGANSIAYVNSRQRLKECGMTGWVAGNYTDSSAARTTGNNPGTSNNNADIKTGQGACATALITSSAAPAVSGWQVTYSCVPAE